MGKRNTVSFQSRTKGARKRLKGLSDEIASQIQKDTITEEKMQDAVDELGDEALELTPYDTGNLYEAQYRDVKTLNFGRGLVKIIGTVGYDSQKAPYAIYVHDGDYTINTSKNPRAQLRYLETAARNKRDSIIRIFKE